MIFQASFYTAVLQNTILYDFMQCNQQYSIAFGVEELPICLNSGFCVDLGKFSGKISQPNCLCSDKFFGPNCQYNVNFSKTGRRVRMKRESIANNRDDDENNLIAKIQRENKLGEPGMIGTVTAVKNEPVSRNDRIRINKRRKLEKCKFVDFLKN